MKRQRNIQQVKKHYKCPPNQTKEEEIGSLPEKEFRIMIVKMIQNLENKMELQINRLETRIKKKQEMAQMVKHLSTMWETRVQSLGWEDALEKEMAIHSSTIAWKIPWTEEPDRLQSIGSQRIRHD